VKHDNPAIVLYVKDIENSLQLIDRENIEEITLFMLSVIKDNVYQNKDYYENLKPLTFGDVFDTFIADKELLESFGVEHLYLFGSFINNEQRLDSDVDLMIRFKTNLNLKEKTKLIEQLKNLYFNKFQRFVDFVEIGTYVSDEIIKKTNNFERVF
jgi:predicted nucleotidyltransferase